MVSAAERGRSLRGVPIEKTGEKWAMKRIEGMLVDRKKRVIRVTRKDVFEKVLPFPPLADNDSSPWPVKFAPRNGLIYVSRWRDVEVLTDDGRRYLANPEEFVQLLRPREHSINPSNLPPRNVVELLYMEHDTLKAAIRQQRHILGERAEEEAAQVEQTMNWIGFLVESVLEGKLTQESIDGLAEQTAEVLESSGLTRAKSQTKKAIAGQTRKAAKKDSRERVNPMVTRIRLRSAYLNAVKRQAQAVLVSEKFTPVLGLLLMEEEFTRQIMQGVKEDLNTLAGFDKRGAIVFEEKRPRVIKGEIQGIKQVLREAAKSLALVRVRPYLPAARVAAINLIGCREEYRELNRSIIGDEADELFKMTPVTELLEMERFRGDRFEAAAERIFEFSYLPLFGVLWQHQDSA